MNYQIAIQRTPTRRMRGRRIHATSPLAALHQRIANARPGALQRLQRRQRVTRLTAWCVPTREIEHNGHPFSCPSLRQIVWTPAQQPEPKPQPEPKAA